MKSILLFLCALPSLVQGHARIASPPIRSPGPAHLQACGQKSYNEVMRDPTGHIEDQMPVNAGCELTLCRGLLLQDQPAANVQKVAPGGNMTINLSCFVPHGGPANVTLIDTTVGGAGQVIGGDLASFSNFCPTGGNIPANQTNLKFNLPTSDVLSSKCATAGDCVVQLYWATPDRKQNYYYCVDVQIA